MLALPRKHLSRMHSVCRTDTLNVHITSQTVFMTRLLSFRYICLILYYYVSWLTYEYHCILQIRFVRSQQMLAAE